MEDYIAHSKNDAGKWHYIKEHLEETAYFMSQFTRNGNYLKIFAQTAFMHDIGKYRPEFQRYITQGGRRGSAPHAFLGASFARYLKQNEIAFVVDGHHKGLPDKAALKVDTVLPSEWKSEKYQEITKIFLQDIGKSEQEFEEGSVTFSGLQREVFIRYLFSALTDADWLSTEKHFNETLFSTRKNISLDYDYLINLLERNINERNKDGHINLLRNEVRQHALSLATGTIGFYSLGLPTGLGKTLISVTWALMHTKKHNLKRIIIVVPYLTIIDQTSKILKTIFGEQWVLEHHSGYNEEEVKQELSKEPHIKKLATENWNYPIIVTTTVQFFDSLFSNKPKRCRKVHNIADSVVIFDEVQTLPTALLAPILSVLQDIKNIMGTSFLFCTATQPAFEKRTNFQNGIEHIVPLVKNPIDIFKNTKRVDYKPVHSFESLSIEELIDKMDVNDGSTLAIFNTKQNAFKAYSEVKKTNRWNKCYHLSKAMCPDHRKKIIKQIRKDLKNKELIFVVSTQLVEAGVDFDFPCVYREIAPLESIIQAAGRCNREGKLLPEEGRLGKVFIFRLENAVFPDKLYETLSLHTLKLLQQNIDQLHDYDFFTAYYAGIVNLFVDTDKKNINEARAELNFETVADMFHLIEDKAISVFIANYSKETLDFLDKIKYKEFLNKDDYNYIQQYSVQVYRKFLEETRGQWEEKEQGYHVWYGSYREDTGICPEPKLSDYIQ
jgi:CRISPR-associated endonuclease/helicase Cas3